MKHVRLTVYIYCTVHVGNVSFTLILWRLDQDFIVPRNASLPFLYQCSFLSNGAQYCVWFFHHFVLCSPHVKLVQLRHGINATNLVAPAPISVDSQIFKINIYVGYQLHTEAKPNCIDDPSQVNESYTSYSATLPGACIKAKTATIYAHPCLQMFVMLVFNSNSAHLVPGILGGINLALRSMSWGRILPRSSWHLWKIDSHKALVVNMHNLTSAVGMGKCYTIPAK